MPLDLVARYAIPLGKDPSAGLRRGELVGMRGDAAMSVLLGPERGAAARACACPWRLALPPAARLPPRRRRGARPGPLGRRRSCRHVIATRRLRLCRWVFISKNMVVSETRLFRSGIFLSKSNVLELPWRAPGRARPHWTLASLGPLSGRVIALERSFWSLHEGEGERRVRGERERGRLRGCGALVKHPQLVRGFGIREAVRAPRRPPTVVHVQARRAAGLRGHLLRGVGSSSHRRVRYASLQ